MRVFNLSPHGDWNDQLADVLVRVRRLGWVKRFEFLRKPQSFPNRNPPSQDKCKSRRLPGPVHLHNLYLVFQLLVSNLISGNAGLDTLVRRILEVHSNEDFYI